MNSRDPARIPETLRLLQEIWQQHPDLRFGQLLLNHLVPVLPCPELYYLEDDELLRRLGVSNPPTLRKCE